MRAAGVAREVLHADRELPRTDSQRNKTMTRLPEASRSLTGGILWEANLLTGTRDIKRLSMGKICGERSGRQCVRRTADCKTDCRFPNSSLQMPDHTWNSRNAGMAVVAGLPSLQTYLVPCCAIWT